MPSPSLSPEKTWEYDCQLILNERKVVKVTITDHVWKKSGRKKITPELILDLVKIFDGRDIEPEPKKNPTWRDVFVHNRISYQGKKYRLIFWFKNGTTDHLWVRNCHQQD